MTMFLRGSNYSLAVYRNQSTSISRGPASSFGISGRRRPSPADRRGFILVVVLIVIAMLSLAGYAFSELMFTERKAARLQGDAIQTRLLAESGVELVKAYLAASPAIRQEAGGHFDNPERFQAIALSTADNDRARFSIIAPPPADPLASKLRFGLDSESARLNLHAVMKWDEQQPGAGRTALLNLPAMTEELADAILDWMDDDNFPREFGAEGDYYGGLEPRYTPANAVPQMLEELMWVRGVSRSLLFGDDRNRNGYLEEDEIERAERQRNAANKSSGPFGWAVYLTLHSAEGNRNSQGESRIDLNQPDLRQLHEQLTKALEEPWATFIVGYRQFGPYLGAATTTPTSQLEPNFDLPGKFRIESVLDLVAVRVQVAYPLRPPLVLSCPFENNRGAMREYLPRLMDHVTTSPEATIVGRVDVNQAPREVLLGIPGMSAGLVEDILSKRGREPGATDVEHQHATWLLVEDVVPLEQIKRLLPYVTGRGDVYRGQAVGYLTRGSIFRADFVVDATTPSPQLVSWKELDRLGRGYNVATLGTKSSTHLP